MYIIGDRVTVTGLRLAGLRNARTSDESSVGQLLQQLPEQTDMVVVTQTLARSAEKEIEKLRRQGIIVTEIPDKSGMGGDEVTKKLVREAIGFDIKT